MIRIVLADDHAIVRAAVRCLLETAADIEIVAEAADGEQALAEIARHEPDVAVVDLAMPRLDGIEVARRLAGAGRRTRVLALSAWEEGRHVRDALAAGVAGYVPKSAAATDLVAAIQVVAAGGQYVHPAVVNAALSTLVRPERPDAAVLSAREIHVLRQLAHGYTIKEISAELSLSMKTVETYKARAMEKIGGASRVDLMRFAAGQGWLKNS
jgi:DNA-binding NarL/FixJ family response regulator